MNARNSVSRQRAFPLHEGPRVRLRLVTTDEAMRRGSRTDRWLLIVMIAVSCVFGAALVNFVLHPAIKNVTSHSGSGRSTDTP